VSIAPRDPKITMAASSAAASTVVDLSSAINTAQATVRVRKFFSAQGAV
jgi:hypothetical protein